MESTSIILENGLEKQVDCLFYLYNNSYYFIYTEKEIDEKGYVILSVVKVGKEITNTPTGPVDTGYMLGVEISDKDEWQNVQKSIASIVDSKKNKIDPSDVRYLPLSMISKIKISGKKTFRLLKSIIEDDFNVKVDSNENNLNLVEENSTEGLSNENLNLVTTPEINNPLPIDNNISNEENGVIIDYRTEFFNEQEKNKQLEARINDLVNQLDEIKKIIG